MTGSASARCRRSKGRTWVEPERGITRPWRCDTNLCPDCGPWRGLRVRDAIARSGADWLITLTRAGECWADAHSRMRRLAEALRRRGITPCWTYVVEADQSGLHVHVLHRGSVGDPGVLDGLASDAGFGLITDVRPVTDVRSAAGYILKAAIGDEQRVGLALPEHLEMNGGRLLHHSRGFFRSAEGSPQTFTEAIRARGRAGGHQWGVAPSEWAADITDGDLRDRRAADGPKDHDSLGAPPVRADQRILPLVRGSPHDPVVRSAQRHIVCRADVPLSRSRRPLADAPRASTVTASDRAP